LFSFLDFSTPVENASSPVSLASTAV